MKVAFAAYDSEDDVSGVSSWLQRMLPRLQAAGLEVEVHVMAVGGQPGVNCAGFKRNGIPFRWKAWEWNHTRSGIRHCWNMLEAGKPDVYVPNCIIPAYYAASHARSNGVATIGVLHADEAFYWGIVDEFVAGRPEYRLSAVVAVSSFLLELVEKSAKETGVGIHQIGYGVPVPNQFASAPKGVFRLIYSGRLVEKQKRVSDVARALCLAAQENPRMEAWIVGEGSGRADVEKIIQTSGVDARRIRLLGRVDVSKIYSLLSDCHAFVLLSDYEGLPVSMLEAMAAGVVPVCLDMRSGIREAIQPGFNGIIVKDRKEDFCAAVQSLERDRSFWSKLSMNARNTIKERFSEEKCAIAWVQLLESFKTSAWKGNSRQPVFLRLPRKNPKFGRFDQRFPRLSKRWGSVHDILSQCKRGVLSSVRPRREKP